MALNYPMIRAKLDANLILNTIGALVAAGLAYIAIIVYRHRSRVNDLRKQGWPMPEGWSWLTGHSLVLLRYGNRLPPLANVALAVREICRDFPETEMFLLDMWPAYPTLIMTFNPESGVVVSQKHQLPKPTMTGDSVKPIVGGPSLLSMNSAEWKTWRTLLNPGFSATSLNEHIPYIVDRVDVFCDKLRAYVGRGIFSLDDFASRLTFEVIMKVTLDACIDNQHSEHILATAFNTINRWHSFWDQRILMHPLRPLIQIYYSNVIKNYVRKELERRYSEAKDDQALAQGTERKVVNSVVALALQAYQEENKNNPALITSRLDDSFAETVTNQVRLFLFAGNDTTSSTMVFVYHLLSKHPDACSRLQQEHDAIFGNDVSKAASLLKEQPALLSRCRYTLAVIKESLRLYPPATSIRMGVPKISLTTLNGMSLPTDGFYLVVNHPAMHQNPRVWVRADEFLPERWLVPQDHELYPPENAYRPFEAGPRACIGQTLSLNELRIILVMTVRTFQISPAYDEWDKIQAQNEGVWKKLKSWLWGREINTVNGDRAYQTEKAGTHPSDGYPCRVETRAK